MKEREKEREQNPHRTFICTRPTLAADLIAQGYEFKQVANPWNAQYRAWSFPISTGLAAFVANYYGNMGRPAPVSISRFLNALECDEQGAGEKL